MRVIVIFIGSCISISLYGQKSDQTYNNDQSLPNSLNPAPAAPHYYAPKKVRQKSGTGPTVETYEQYVARMKRTVKAIEKNERLMRKPQYSNPLYFGHKRLPKKHKAGKLKFCKECGIRH
jgi:hypothetical protein